MLIKSSLQICSRFVPPELLPTFIIPQPREGVTWWSWWSSWVIEEGTRHFHLQPSLSRREGDLDGIMADRIAVPGVLDGKLHLC